METREDWLSQAVTELRPLFDNAGRPLPDKIRVTCGFPANNARSAHRRAIGQHWSSTNSDDQTHEILVSPVLDDDVDVFAVLVHELAHAATDGDGHRGRFPALVRTLGLEGAPTSTVAGEKFKSQYKDLIASLGPYPHAKINVPAHLKKQSTRMLKASCGCGYTIRLTKRWADAGLPTCICGGSFQLS